MHLAPLNIARLRLQDEVCDADWFTPVQGAQVVAWWVEQGHLPTANELVSS